MLSHNSDSNPDSDLNPDSRLFGLDSDSVSDSIKYRWNRIHLDSDSRYLDSDPDS